MILSSHSRKTGNPLVRNRAPLHAFEGTGFARPTLPLSPCGRGWPAACVFTCRSVSAEGADRDFSSRTSAKFGAVRGDVWLVALVPTVGSEIHKTRPVVFISPPEMHDYLRTVIVAPMTTGRGPRLIASA